jgi:hypothetical protein
MQETSWRRHERRSGDWRLSFSKGELNLLYNVHTYETVPIEDRHKHSRKPE